MLIKEKGCADFRRSSVRAKGMFCANWYMPDLGAFGHLRRTVRGALEGVAYRRHLLLRLIDRWFAAEL
jgi:hypothetical protein